MIGGQSAWPGVDAVMLCTLFSVVVAADDDYNRSRRRHHHHHHYRWELD